MTRFVIINKNGGKFQLAADSWRTAGGLITFRRILTALNMTGTWSNGGTSITVASTASLLAGYTVSGVGIPIGTTISSITNGTTFVISASATAAGTGADIKFSDTLDDAQASMIIESEVAHILRLDQGTLVTDLIA